MQDQPIGVVGGELPVEFPDERDVPEDVAGVAHGQHGGLQAGVVHAVVWRPDGSACSSGRDCRRVCSTASPGPGSSTATALVGDPRVRAISFTGSTGVGESPAERRREPHPHPTELGGKNAMMVIEDADLGSADAGTGGFSYAGQWCTSTSRILLHHGVARPFLEALTARCHQHDRRRRTAGRHGQWDRSPDRSNMRMCARRFAPPGPTGRV